VPVSVDPRYVAPEPVFDSLLLAVIFYAFSKPFSFLLTSRGF
jgi:hypothetical protein